MAVSAIWQVYIWQASLVSSGILNHFSYLACMCRSHLMCFFYVGDSRLVVDLFIVEVLSLLLWFSCLFVWFSFSNFVVVISWKVFLIVSFFFVFYFRCRVLSTLEYNNLLTNDYSTFICESNNLGDVMFPDGGSTEAEIVCSEDIFSGLCTLSLQYLI